MRLVKKLFISLAALIVVGLPAVVRADTITFRPPATAPNNNNSTNNPNNSNYQGGANQFDLDHHRAYTWQINNINIPQGQVITGATLTFTSIRNWDTNPNRLFVHLLDSARNYSSSTSTRSATVNGVTSFLDVNPNQAPVTSIADNFAGSLLASNPLVASGTGNILLFDRSFNTTATTYTFTFTSAQLQMLAQFLANGQNIAFGLDADCHFWNNGITFTIMTGHPNAIPEPMTLTLLGTGLAGLYYQRRRRQQRARA
jgi:PEP-CTERM motif-containing protein